MQQKTTLNRRRIPLWILFVLAATTLLTENFLDYPLGLPHLTRLAGGRRLLDLRLWYGPAAVYDLFDALGDAGRSAYLQLLWTVDLWLPFICAAFLSAAISRGRFRACAWLPAIVAACDYAENTAITVLLRSYPTQLPSLVIVSSTLTLLKFLGYLIAITLAIAGYCVRSSSDAGKPL